MKKFIGLYLDSYRGMSRPAWMLALVMLLNRSGAMVIPFLGVYMTKHLHFSLKDAGVVLSCFGIGAVIGSFVGGWLTDKIGNFKVQLFSLLLAVPMFLLLPELNTVVKLAVGVFFLSIITESFRPANSVSVAHYANPENITRSFSLNRMAINLGFSIGPALGGFLAAISYSFLFYGNALGAFLAGSFFFFYFRNIKIGPKVKTAVAVDKDMVVTKAPASPYKDTLFLLYTIFSCFYAICFFQLLSTMPLYYRQVYNLSESSIGLILAFSGLVVFSLEMLLVHISERRLGTHRSIILGVALCGISFLIFNIAHSVIILYVSIFVLCISEILAIPFMSTVTMSRSSEHNRGAYMGLNSLAFSAANIFSPFLGTRVAANWGFETLWWCTAGVILVTSLGMYWVLGKMKDTK